MPEKQLESDRIEQTAALMEAFAERTGLTSDTDPIRYLWTDAFAVCNYIGLARAAEEQRFQELAERLAAQVHQTLGHHREDDPRQGWISGLPEEEGREHPTKGGLRIGKKLPERAKDAPIDDRLEWDRDGQYFHYLTKWMHALDILARSQGEPRYARWSRELAETSTDAFVYRTDGTLRMYWKMSIDLSRPLVPAMGQHDPLDGYITVQQLRATAKALGAEAQLQDEMKTFAKMVGGGNWRTIDPLGLGGLLMDAARLAQLIADGASNDHALLAELLRSAESGISVWAHAGDLDQPAPLRLAFRELGLAIGLEAVQWLQAQETPLEKPKQAEALRGLDRYQEVGRRIIAFWRNPEHRKSPSWLEHEDINAVMLAAALAPQGFLRLPEVS